MQNAEDDGHEYQRSDCCKNEAADDGTAERRVLLAAFAEAERHRRHADDHRERGHQHRTEAHEAGLECGEHAVAVHIQALAREADDQHAVRGRHAHAHDRAGERRDRERGAGRKQHPDDAGKSCRQRRDDDERITP